jgi:hypothetical protein
MGFYTCSIDSPAQSRVSLKPLAPLRLGGKTGLLARVLGSKQETGQWILSAEKLLESSQATKGNALLFTPSPLGTPQSTIYQLVEIRGRTASLVTDALFHFKVRTSLPGSAGELLVENWESGADHYEYLRLEGGWKGGSWAWSEPPQALSATVLNSPRPKPVN